MKACKKCNASVHTTKTQCPLCFDELEKTEGVQQAVLYNTANYAQDIASKNYFLHKFFLFLTICVSSVCLFINFMTNKNVFWSLAIIVSLLYVWILVRHTIISRRGHFEKILFQFVGILAVFSISNHVAGGANWFWHYILPSASLVTTTILTFVLLVNNKRSDFVLSFFLISLVLVIISVVVLFVAHHPFKLLHFINLLYNGLFALGILIFAFNHLKRGLHKTFHI